MKDLSTPLSDDEWDLLNRFLLERIDEEADTLDKDEGVLDVSELDGLFTAVVSGPVTVMPSSWLPAVWGDFEPVWESEGDFRQIFSLMVRHMNAISSFLMECPEDFEPLFLEREVEGKTYYEGSPELAAIREWEGRLEAMERELDEVTPQHGDRHSPHVRLQLLPLHFARDGIHHVSAALLPAPR